MKQKIKQTLYFTILALLIFLCGYIWEIRNGVEVKEFIQSSDFFVGKPVEFVPQNDKTPDMYRIQVLGIADVDWIDLDRSEKDRLESGYVNVELWPIKKFGEEHIKLDQEYLFSVGRSRSLYNAEAGEENTIYTYSTEAFWKVSSSKEVVVDCGRYQVSGSSHIEYLADWALNMFCTGSSMYWPPYWPVFIFHFFIQGIFISILLFFVLNKLLPRFRTHFRFDLKRFLFLFISALLLSLIVFRFGIEGGLYLFPFACVPAIIFGLLGSLISDKFLNSNTFCRVGLYAALIIMIILVSMPVVGAFWHILDMMAGYFPTNWLDVLITGAVPMGFQGVFLIALYLFPWSIIYIMFGYFLLSLSIRLSKHEK